jgi:hypothetical protein
MGMVNQELLLQNAYPAAENRIEGSPNFPMTFAFMKRFETRLPDRRIQSPLSMTIAA